MNGMKEMKKNNRLRVSNYVYASVCLLSCPFFVRSLRQQSSFHSCCCHIPLAAAAAAAAVDVQWQHRGMC